MAGTDSDVPLVWWSRGAVVLALAVTTIDWLGWTSGIRPLTHISSQWPQMTPWTATLLSGLAIAILLQVGHSRRRLMWAGRAMAVFAGAVAAVFLVEYATGRSFGLDLALFPGALSAEHQSLPGRPAALAALSILALAGTVALMTLERRWITRAWPLGIDRCRDLAAGRAA